jgi:hypothetical protein
LGPVVGNPSVVAAGFTGVALVAAGVGFGYSRRRRPAAPSWREESRGA